MRAAFREVTGIRSTVLPFAAILTRPGFPEARLLLSPAGTATHRKREFPQGDAEQVGIFHADAQFEIQ